MEWIEIFKAVLFGIVEGITEWLPISSTGHMILLEEFVSMGLSQAFKDMFLVVVQLGAILAVVVLYWSRIWPFRLVDQRSDLNQVMTVGRFPIGLDRDIFQLWLKILIGCVPAAIVGILFSEQLKLWFYRYLVVALMLILFGIGFILIERRNRHEIPRVTRMDQISYRLALWIGVFQLIAAVFPGTSRSGATILGGILLGMARPVAAEFTFYLAIPVMLGASLLELVRFGFKFTALELAALFVGMATAYVVSTVVIQKLMQFIRRRDFTPFGVYRIVLGLVVLVYFGLIS